MWVAILIVLTCATIGLGTAHLTKRHDTIVEELAEDIIEDQTGISIDLTASSSEDD